MSNPQAGLLAHPGDHVSLAQDINQVLSSSDQKEMLARLGLEQVQKYYWDQLARIMESVYLSDI